MSERIPANAPATEIARLRGVNSDILEQVLVLHETRDRNFETIGVLEHFALWNETPPLDIPVEEEVE